MSEKLSEKIYISIIRDIASGKLDSRTFLSEAQVAEQYGVSKAPVRDALHLLVSQGYLISYHRKGYLVNSFSVDELNQLQAIRRQLEKMAVELIIENASDEEIEKLREFTPDKMELSNHFFHLELARLSGNQYLPEALEPYLHKLTFAKFKAKYNVDAQMRLIDALLARDLAGAYERLDENIQFF